MRSDLEVIQMSFPTEQTMLRVYAIGDVHVGSPEFDEEAIRKKIRIIEEDPYGVVCICGDLGDFGLRNSKSNVYKALLQPRDQVEYIFDLFSPIKDKIAACIPGNHEERLVREIGMCPLYDLCVRWGIEDKYRENMAITKYSFGSIRGKKQQIVFIGLTTHGSAKTRHSKFTSCFSNIDFSVSGHNHTPNYSPRGRIVVDKTHATAKLVPYKEIVVDAHLKPGGYGIKKEYEIPPPPELQCLELQVVYDTDHKRTMHRIMNYRTFQI